MLLKEYRICMPLTVEEYRIGQLYMISKHSCEQSGGGEGVEVVKNESDTHPEYGRGQLTEKRIYLNRALRSMHPRCRYHYRQAMKDHFKHRYRQSNPAHVQSPSTRGQKQVEAYIACKLPAWAKTFVPRFFYVTEKSWNFYPYTITEYSVSYLPKFSIRIETRFENNNGDNSNVFGDTPTQAENVSFLDILSDPIPEKHYKESEDLSRWQSSKTGRGPLENGWRDNHKPIMCSYKRVQCSFEVYGLQTRTEEFVHRIIRDILLVGHRQAVSWIDEWHGLSLEDVREYEQVMQEKTNSKVKSSQNTQSPTPPRPAFSRSMSVTDERSLMKMGAMPDLSVPNSPVRLNSTPE